MAHIHHEFPKYKYHRELDPVVVHTPEHEAELGDDWADSPAAFLDEQAGIPTGDELDIDEPVARPKGKKKAK